MTRRQTIPAVPALVAGLALLSVWLGPDLGKLRREGNQAEAYEMLDRIARGAALYGSAPRKNIYSGKLQPCQFPATAGWGSSCCVDQNDADGDDRCDLYAGEWSSPTWKALQFRIRTQHWYAYGFESWGTGVNAKFAAVAVGDLDCDLNMSKFRLEGRITAVLPDGTCKVQVDKKIVAVSPLE